MTIRGALTCETHSIEWDKNYSGPRCPLCVQEEITSMAFEEMDRVKKKLDAWRGLADALENEDAPYTRRGEFRAKLKEMGELK